jgi:hypothetical protein
LLSIRQTVHEARDPLVLCPSRLGQHRQVVVQDRAVAQALYSAINAKCTFNQHVSSVYCPPQVAYPTEVGRVAVRCARASVTRRSRIGPMNGSVQQLPKLGEVLAHLFNHQTHHRSHPHASLATLDGNEPESLDLLRLLRERSAP